MKQRRNGNHARVSSLPAAAAAAPGGGSGDEEEDMLANLPSDGGYLNQRNSELGMRKASYYSDADDPGLVRNLVEATDFSKQGRGVMTRSRSSRMVLPTDGGLSEYQRHRSDIIFRTLANGQDPALRSRLEAASGPSRAFSAFDAGAAYTHLEDGIGELDRRGSAPTAGYQKHRSAIFLKAPSTISGFTGAADVEKAVKLQPPKKFLGKVIYHTLPYVDNFMAGAQFWYKVLIIFFIILNALIFPHAPKVAAWCLVVEFILTLALALQCYPLQPGGLLVFCAYCQGFSSTEHLVEEIEANLEVILLLIFMVSATFFLKRFLLFTFSKILISIKNKILLCILFSCTIGLMSAFLDALTVTAIMISVGMGFVDIYTETADQIDASEPVKKEGDQFRRFLRDLFVHGIVATAYGGGITSVGEPQNLIAASQVCWNFTTFFYRMLPVTFPVAAMGILTIILLEKFKLFGFGTPLPDNVRNILADFQARETKSMTRHDRAQIVGQAAVSIFIVVGLVAQIAPPGLIGLAAIVLVTILVGVTEEHELGKAFQDSLPFTALLVVFFGLVAIIAEQQLFAPIIDIVVGISNFKAQIAILFFITGVLSMISDNVFVAAVFLGELTRQLQRNCEDHDGVFVNEVFPRNEYDILTVVTLAGVNILGIATPNGQAAFLFLYTSALAPTLGLTYVKMMRLIAPYTLLLTLMGFVSLWFIVIPSTDSMIASGPLSGADGVQACNCFEGFAETAVGGEEIGHS